MKPSKKIEQIRKACIEVFGEEDAIIRSLEIRDQYVKIHLRFQELRERGAKYEEALQSVALEFGVSDSTVRGANSFAKSLVKNK